METAREEPQAFFSTYAPRLREYQNSLLTPVLPSSQPIAPLSRTTKRGTTIINYAEDGYDIEASDTDDRRRPTGLRSLRREDSQTKIDVADKVNKETSEPVTVPAIYRDYINKAKPGLVGLQNYAQAALPLTLIPIRIDLDIPAWIPAPQHPLPPQNTSGVDFNMPQYRIGEPTLPYKLKDTFLWNLHETLITTDQFALTLVQDLDLPPSYRSQFVAEISKQIRTQLEEYAGVALHPLFHSHTSTEAAQQLSGASIPATPLAPAASFNGADNPARSAFSHLPATPSRLSVSTPGPAAASATDAEPTAKVTATAEHVSVDSDDQNPDDTYRCIINLTINLGNQLYSDKFEWSLLHPSGTAEAFSKQTCADLGLTGEWVPAMTHAIYEATLRMKKEACESGGVVSGWVGANALNPGADFPNDAAISAAGERAGWRYDPEHLADEWEPKIEILSQEEIEKREGDRERQLRRLRRETARFSSNTGMVGGVPSGFGFAGLIEQEEERMGRGERSKKKKRFRSLSPVARASTPGGRFTPDVGGGYGGGGALTDVERFHWRCAHCEIWGTSVWAVRDGPHGPRVSFLLLYMGTVKLVLIFVSVQSLCSNCGFIYERDRKLPRWTQKIHRKDAKLV